MQLDQKETSLLKDLKDQEKVCVEKYTKYASEACDGQLKNLFMQIAQTEQGHYDTIEQIMSGTMPQTNQGGGSGSGSEQQSFSETYKSNDSSECKQKDTYLCTDALSTEKHVSSVYNTCIFEFKNTQLRDVLNHIQKEEQHHGDSLYKYMSSNNMYC